MKFLAIAFLGLLSVESFAAIHCTVGNNLTIQSGGSHCQRTGSTSYEKLSCNNGQLTVVSGYTNSQCSGAPLAGAGGGGAARQQLKR